ncbi:MAG: hypothetical protein E4H40_04110 [Candidatus Brocadiia bacterium]|nr:MAG: hypothetical protein E4H40_04110 [Candidatus Brocadiia bacterium]
MKKLIMLILVVMIVVLGGCRSKKTAEPNANELQAQPKVETKVETVAVKVPAVPPVAKTAKPPAALPPELMVNCEACGGTLKPKEDKTAMVCVKCGKEMDMKTYNNLRMQKVIEVMGKMKAAQDSNK